MRANRCAVLCACVLAGFVAGPANAADYVTGYRPYAVYRAPVLYGPRQVLVEAVPYDAYAEAYASEPYTPPPVYCRPVERRQVVRFSEFSHSSLEAYAAAEDGYAIADVGCTLQKTPDWLGGWVWTKRAGCF
jgi:hypothetical protein